MKAEWKAKLIEALESGKYTRTTGGFRFGPNCFCAQGVLLDISGLGHWENAAYVYQHPKLGRRIEGGYIAEPYLLEFFGMNLQEAKTLFRVSDSLASDKANNWEVVLKHLKEQP